MSVVAQQLRRLRGAGGRVADRALDAAARSPALGTKARELRDAISPLGLTVAVLGFAAWIAGWVLGWSELMVAAGACLVLLATCALFVVRPPALRTEIVLDPPRLTAGDSAVGQITATNLSSRRTPPAQIELPVGEGRARFAIHSLASGADIQQEFIIPTERRGVIPVGPATSVRGDPLGLFHREARSSGPRELIVHPRTIPIDPFGSGLLRDLEGVPTKHLSTSDLNFHALRDYVPGDDLRHVHWKSSAKANRVLIRQFQDTRRSTLCAVVDCDAGGYGDPGEFETALEVAASLAMRACRDEVPATLIAGAQAASGSIAHLLLDALSRARLGGTFDATVTQVGRTIARGADISFGVLVSGSSRANEQLQRMAGRFPLEVKVVAIKVVTIGSSGVYPGERASLLQLQKLADLPALLRLEAGL